MASSEVTAEVKPLLTLYSYDRDDKKYGQTMFVNKLHFHFRYAGIPYEASSGSRGQAPKSKMPYVKFNETGEFMGDSALITQKLIAMGKLEDVNAHLSPQERAQDYCLRSMIEDKIYFHVVSLATILHRTVSL
jgi:hypothetical protein